LDFSKARTGKEYFFHRSGATNFYGLREGDPVSFDPKEGEKGPRAENVVPLEEAVR
jgi:cold shock CspA family protein